MGGDSTPRAPLGRPLLRSLGVEPSNLRIYGAGQEPDHILGGLSQLKNLMKYYSMRYSGPGLDLGQTGLVYLNPTYLEPYLEPTQNRYPSSVPIVRGTNQLQVPILDTTHGTAIYICRSVGVVPGGSMGRANMAFDYKRCLGIAFDPGSAPANSSARATRLLRQGT